ncbi:hypothetical protein J5N97_002067 [Dioscorea zingiberensis]|uniref:Uncharacterized protein n=1 Tax=Dioscorea zingiberensis TaxID=325984 RepID=A0A9D5BT02_9LILI|nr:hypothetical protein J5N97_002067 [Dioscorea zingiberensis]
MENKTALFLNASIMRGMKELIFPSGIYEKLYLIKLLEEFSLDECNAVGAGEWTEMLFDMNQHVQCIVCVVRCVYWWFSMQICVMYC